MKKKLCKFEGEQNKKKNNKEISSLKL